MTFQLGNRVAVDVEWSEAYNVHCTIVELDDDGVVAQLIADEPCFDNGKYELDRRGKSDVQFLRPLSYSVYHAVDYNGHKDVLFVMEDEDAEFRNKLMDNDNYQRQGSYEVLEMLDADDHTSPTAIIEHAGVTFELYADNSMKLIGGDE